MLSPAKETMLLGLYSRGYPLPKSRFRINAWRAPHYHTNTAELSVLVKGKARAGVITPQNELIVEDLTEGDCIFFPMGWTHWIRNTGEVVIEMYFNYGNEQPATVEVANIVAHFSDIESSLLPLRGHKQFTETE
jgi:mannose-6-phosphate isomerase-like protein (cupin superfamily)